jgi:hypothetical protein
MNFFENKDIRASSNNVARIDASTEIYNSYLYTNNAANFHIPFSKTLMVTLCVFKCRMQRNKEADYAWVYFSLSASD